MLGDRGPHDTEGEPLGGGSSLGEVINLFLEDFEMKVNAGERS
ncbi:MAG: hypothetical protein AAGJ46_19385 [Planctomycetota bacterium]